MPLIPALGKPRQAWTTELVPRTDSSKATQRNPDLKNYKNKQKRKIDAQGIQFVGPRPYLEGDVLWAQATKGHGVL